jgi:hypothetical protein
MLGDMPSAWLVAVVLWIGPPSPTPPPALERAERAFVAGDYARASAEFAAAYAAEPNPRYLYAQAQAERLAGNCAHALQLYDEFLALHPPEQAAADARANRARCSTAAEATPEVTTDPTPNESAAGDPTQGPSDRPKPPRDRSRAWYRDPWGGALVGSGLFVGGIGVGLMINAARLDADAGDAPTEGAYETTRDDARLRQRFGLGTTIAGAALFVGGVVRWTVIGVRNNRRVSVIPTGRGIALTGRF